MGTLVVILIVAALAAGVWWNHRNAAAAREGVGFAVPFPPSAVAAAIDLAHNKGALAAVRGMLGGMSVEALGPTGFATSNRNGDTGEISITKDPAGCVVHARALNLSVGIPQRQLNKPRTGLYAAGTAMAHGIYTVLGITPGAAGVKRWQNGLQNRITKALARAGA